MPVISSAWMMSTPAPTRLASVRLKRAMPTFRTTGPIPIGIRMRKRSQCRRPDSVRFQRKKPQIARAIAGKSRK